MGAVTCQRTNRVLILFPPSTKGVGLKMRIWTISLLQIFISIISSHKITKKDQVENDNVINQTVQPTNDEESTGEPQQQLTSMIYNLWRKTKRGGNNNFKREKNCDRGNETVLVQIRSPFDHLMTRVTMPNSKSQVQFNKGKNWRETYVMHENTPQQHRRPGEDIFKTKNRPLIHRGVSLQYKKNYKKSFENHNHLIQMIKMI